MNIIDFSSATITEIRSQLGEKLPKGTYNPNTIEVSTVWKNYLDHRAPESAVSREGYVRTRKIVIQRSGWSSFGEGTLALCCLMISKNRAFERYNVVETEIQNEARYLFLNDPKSPQTNEILKRAYRSCIKIIFCINLDSKVSSISLKKGNAVVNFAARNNREAKPTVIIPQLDTPHEFAQYEGEESKIREHLLTRMPPSTYSPESIKVKNIWYDFTRFREGSPDDVSCESTLQITLSRKTAAKIWKSAAAFFYSSIAPEHSRAKHESKDKNIYAASLFSDFGQTPENLEGIQSLHNACKKIVFYYSKNNGTTHIEVDDCKAVVASSVTAESLRVPISLGISVALLVSGLKR